ncbi:MAG: TonB-dependent receptor [Cyanobacteria bacterium P01_A01_bin.17]
MVTTRILTALPLAGVISLLGLTTHGLAVSAEESATVAMASARAAALTPASKAYEPKSSSQNQPGPDWIAQETASPAQITDVQLETTEAGLQLVLETTADNLPTSTTTVSGNALIAEIPDALLVLPDGDEFQQFEPDSSIALITVTNLPGNIVQVVITGTDAPPMADISAEGRDLILSITPGFEVEAIEPETDAIRVIVTAEKRPEPAQDIPISITALTVEEIQDADIVSLQGIAENTPNFSVLQAGSNRAFTYSSLRGLSNFNFGSRDRIGFYIDDVPYDGGALGLFSPDLPDIERVEVLRGPQGTLYGRNAQAGVVNIITRRPSDVFEFDGTVGYGNFDRYDLRASVSSPIIDDELFFRLSGSYITRDGYTTNTLGENNRIDGQSGVTGRGQLLWTPSEVWEISLNANVEDYRDGAYVSVPLSASDPFETERDFEGFNDLISNAQSLRVIYRQPAFQITSITAHRYSSTEGAFDADASSADAAIRVLGFDTHSISQEIRVQPPDDVDSRFRWLAGAYYEFFNLGSDQGLEFGPDAATLGLAPFAGVDRAQFDIDTETYALFGQASYDITEALTLTAGLRYEITDSVIDNFDQAFTPTGGDAIPTLVLNDIGEESSELIPRFAAEYRFNPNVLLYGSISRSYRPAAANAGTLSPETAILDAERGWNYELGLKSSWLDDRLTVNLSAFYNPVNDFQLVGFTPQGEIFADNADVAIAGGEIELRATPVDGLDLIAGLGIVDATFGDYIDPFSGEDLGGNTLPFAPDLTYNLAIQYRSPIGIFGRLELQGLGTTYYVNDNSLEQDPFSIVNARLGYESNDYGIYLFVNNIFNTEYVTNALPFIPEAIATYGMPTTFGVQFRKRL